VNRAASNLGDYYREVQGYHQLVEDQLPETFVVPPELLLRFIDRSDSVVDVAGGSGINARILNVPESNYICLDLSFVGLRIAAEKRRGMCIQADVEEIPLQSNSVGTVLCSWSLEHLTDPGRVLDEMIRIVKPGGRILIWGPNWDNIFRKDFPQFVHRKKTYVVKVRWKVFFRMMRNEFFPFRYDPYVDMDVAALADPTQYISGDTDAVHCVLCQETYKFFERRDMSIIHVSDFSHMGKHLYNDWMIRVMRLLLKPLLPVLRRILLVRWFVMRFPIVVEKPR
jgi:SAM-dependent methyltransferase